MEDVPQYGNVKIEPTKEDPRCFCHHKDVARVGSCVYCNCCGRLLHIYPPSVESQKLIRDYLETVNPQR